MKHMISGMVIALALALVLVIGVVALAESAEAPQLPEAGDLQEATEAPEAQAPEEAQPEQAQDTQDAAALQEAMKALNEARQSSHEESLQAELDGYVESGKLTQAQADLIMKYYQDQSALRNGTCPGCGYQFGNGQQGKGGRGNRGFGGQGMNGGQQGKGGRGNRGFGGQGMNGGFGGQGTVPGVDGQQPSAPGMQNPGQPNAFNEGI